MFFNKKSYSLEDSLTTIIAEGTEISGNINAKGSMRFDGEIKGDIKVKGKLVIGEKSVIKGSIGAYDVEVSGKLHGDMNVENNVTLLSKSFIEGNISTKSLIVESGSVFNGSCIMNTESSSPIIEEKNNEDIK